MTTPPLPKRVEFTCEHSLARLRKIESLKARGYTILRTYCPVTCKRTVIAILP